MTVLTGVISYPIPPFQNLPIEPQFYQPSVFDISSITMGFVTTVTTTVNHNYVVGQQVRLLIPPGDGCRELNNTNGFVQSIPSANQVIVNINSYGANPYVNNNIQQLAQILAMGDVNTGPTNIGRTGNITYIPGSFINISPK